MLELYYISIILSSNITDFMQRKKPKVYTLDFFHIFPF